MNSSSQWLLAPKRDGMRRPFSNENDRSDYKQPHAELERKRAQRPVEPSLAIPRKRAASVLAG